MATAISDCRRVDPLFGTLAGIDHLIDAAHRSGIKVVLDPVPNHTSEEHPRFKAAPLDRGRRTRPH